MGAPSVNHWLQDIMRKLQKQPDEIPKGWESSYDIASKLGTSRGHTQRTLTAAINAGLVQMRKFNVQRNKRVYSVRYYHKK